MDITPSMFSIIICKLDLPYACGFNGIPASVLSKMYFLTSCHSLQTLLQNF